MILVPIGLWKAQKGSHCLSPIQIATSPEGIKTLTPRITNAILKLAILMNRIKYRDQAEWVETHKKLFFSLYLFYISQTL